MSETIAGPATVRSRALALEALWLAAIGVSVFALVLALAHRAGALVYLPVAWDAWFDTDSTRVYDDISQRTSVLSRGSYHPLFGLVGHGPYALLSALLGARGFGVVQVELALVSAGLALACAALYRTAGCRRCEASVFTALAVTSAAFVFFAGVPETFPFGALSIVAGLLAVARARGDRASDVIVGLVAAVAAAITVTNVLPIAAALWWRRRSVSLARIAGAAALALALGTVAQVWVFPRSVLAPLQMLGLGATSISKPDDVFTGDLVPPPSLGHLGRVVRVFFLHSAVMPEPQVMGIAPRLLTLVPSPLRVLSVQGSPIDWRDPLYLSAAIAWLALLGWAGARFVRGPRSTISVLVVSGIAVQLVLHLVVGRETFLYALHFQPLLVAFVATLVEGRRRGLAVALAGVATLLGAANNFRAFEHATTALNEWGRPVDLTPFAVATQREPISLASRFRLPDLPIEIALARENGAPIEVRAVEDLPGVWSIEARPEEVAGGGLIVEVAATDASAPGRPPLLGWMASSAKGEYVFLGHRWALLSRPLPNAFKTFSRRNERCGELSGPCIRMQFGKANRWRFTIQDLLARPMWLGTPLPWGDRAWKSQRAAWRDGAAEESPAAASGGAEESEEPGARAAGPP